MNAIISQIAPQTVMVHDHTLSDVKMLSPRDGQQPQISANALASEVLTFRRMVSSARHVSGALATTKRIQTDNVPQDVHTRHNTDK